MTRPVATLEETIPGRPRLVIELLPEQQAAVQEALDTLLGTVDDSTIQQIVSDALQTAADQRYFWTPEWQAQEQKVEKAIAEGRVRTFDTMEDMIDFLDEQ